VELTDPRIIAALKGDAIKSDSERRGQPRQSRPLKTISAQMERRKRCMCGTCPACLDNARWEAIFNAKFADPNYYKPRPIRSGSSLDWLRPAQRSGGGRTVEP